MGYTQSRQHTDDHVQFTGCQHLFLEPLDSVSVRIHVTLKIAHPVIYLPEQFLGSHLVLTVVGNASFG